LYCAQSAIDKRGAQPAALFIGLTVTLGILAIGNMTGGALNPARHLGSALIGGHFADLWLYWAGPLAGGVLAGLLYHNVLEARG
jgi:aquaporin Z